MWAMWARWTRRAGRSAKAAQGGNGAAGEQHLPTLESHHRHRATDTEPLNSFARSPSFSSTTATTIPAVLGRPLLSPAISLPAVTAAAASAAASAALPLPLPAGESSKPTALSATSSTLQPVHAGVFRRPLRVTTSEPLLGNHPAACQLPNAALSPGSMTLPWLLPATPKIGNPPYVRETHAHQYTNTLACSSTLLSQPPHLQVRTYSCTPPCFPLPPVQRYLLRRASTRQTNPRHSHPASELTNCLSLRHAALRYPSYPSHPFTQATASHAPHHQAPRPYQAATQQQGTRVYARSWPNPLDWPSDYPRPRFLRSAPAVPLRLPAPTHFVYKQLDP